MVPQINSDRRSFFCFKGIALLFCIVWIAGSLSCNSPTGSTSGPGPGVGWTISITTSKNSASSSVLEVVTVIVTVKDSSGLAALQGTQICVSASRGGFLLATDGTSNTVVAARCIDTANNEGQITVFYLPAVMSTDSTGTQTQVPISTGPDTITASSKGVIRSTTINVVP